MKTNFFECITGLQSPGIWKLGIHQDEDGRFVVSALYAPNHSTDPLAKTVAPLIFKGTAQELDEGFFTAIEKPVQDTIGLYTTIAEYTETVEAAKKKAAQQGKQTARPATNVKDEGMEVPSAGTGAAEKANAYREVMKKIADLNDHCKYNEALSLLPSAGEYPDKQEELAAKRKDLERKQAQYNALSLFSSPQNA